MGLSCIQVSLAIFIALRAGYIKGARECDDGEVRLEDTAGPYVGRVGLCYRGEWGSVSHDHKERISDKTAHVVCRQLGLTLHDPKLVLQYGGAKGPVHISLVQCSGNESSLLDCRHDKVYSRGPGSWLGRDIGVSCAPPCREGEVRLVRDRVQSCHKQVWGYICFTPDSWTHHSARVVCTELGSTSEEALADHDGLHRTSFQVFTNLTNCTGSEQQLRDCPQSSHQQCSYKYYVAKAYCSGTERCRGNETVRLRDLGGNTGNNVGRLEICSGGYWGSVCDHDIHGPTSATIACRELGYFNLLSASFAPIGLYDVTLPNIPIISEDLQCQGNEGHLSECLGLDDFHYCTNWEDVVLHCTVRECNDTDDVRLVGGGSAAEGTVQICQSGVWVPVCDRAWNSRGAGLVCRQLGYHGSSYALREHVSSFQENYNMNSTSLYCFGFETTLSECRPVKEHGCRAKAAVLCTEATCEEGAVRLVGGHSNKEGRVQVCSTGEWHSVCTEDWSESRTDEASALCSELGYSGHSVVGDFGRDVAPTLSLDIHCDRAHQSCNITSHSSQLLECQKVAGIICEAHCVSEGTDFCSECSGPAVCPVNDICYCSSECFHTGNCCPDVDQLLTCLPNDGCETGEVRLVGGVANASSGVVELCVDGVWGTICDRYYEWGHENAAVVCRQLNLPVDDAYGLFTRGFDSASSHPVLLDSVHCTGSEDSLLNCPHASLGNHLCTDTDFIHRTAIICRADCEDGDVRLGGGESGASSGRVEMCYNGMWSSVCSDEWWDTLDATVVCRQLGFDTQDVEVMEVTGSVGPILMAGVSCMGEEGELFNCSSLVEFCEDRGVRAGVRCHFGAPGSIEVSEVTASSVIVSWDPVAGADSYTVTIREMIRGRPCHQSSNDTISFDNTNPFVVIRDKLRAYTNYSITVTTQSESSNTSQQSKPFIFTTAQKGSSVAPRNVRVSFVNSTVITVQWDGLVPCTQVNGLIVRYRVLYTAEGSGEVGTKEEAGEWDVIGAEVAVDQLSPYTNYSIVVAAVNQVGDVGLYSDIITVTTADDVPGAVVGLKVSSSNKGRLSLTWSPPLRPNGVLIAYEVSYSLRDSSQLGTTSNRVNTSGLATSYTIEEGELKVGTEYSVSVRAYTRAGPGQSSSVVVTSTLTPTSEVSDPTKSVGHYETKPPVTELPKTASPTRALASPMETAEPDITVPNTATSRGNSTGLAIGGVLGVLGLIVVAAGTIGACVFKVRTGRFTPKVKNIATEDNPAYASVRWNKKGPSPKAGTEVKTEENPAYVTICRGHNSKISDGATKSTVGGTNEEVVYDKCSGPSSKATKSTPSGKKDVEFPSPSKISDATSSKEVVYDECRDPSGKKPDATNPKLSNTKKVDKCQVPVATLGEEVVYEMIPI